MGEAAWFPPVPASVTAARQWLAEVLAADGRAGRVLDAEVCLSELAANAVNHAGTEFEVEISDDGRNVRIAVRDRSHRPVSPQQPAPNDIAGRGLQIVAALADRWGVDPIPDGKIVWCTLEV
jgi:anti-sigma regulatory factor (Ser/Thr protein kinase)